MYTQTRQLIESVPVSSSRSSARVSQFPENPALFRGVVESLGDGIMILTEKGELVHTNSHAHRLCQLLAQNQSYADFLPRQIWQSCQTLIKNRDAFPDQVAILDEEIRVGDSVVIRMRIHWIEMETLDRPHLLVTLEDQTQTARYRAIAEAWKYGLTRREAEVWLLKRAGCKYKEIAAQLHIAEDTVKKHIKNIYARRDAMECWSA